MLVLFLAVRIFFLKLKSTIVECKEGDLIKFKEKERYRIYNTLSDNHGYFLTIIKVIKNKVYYLFDGDEEIKCFEVGSQFELDLIKVV